MLSMFGPLAAGLATKTAAGAGTSFLSAAAPSLIGAGVGGLMNIAGGMFGAGSASKADNKAWQRQKYLIKYGPQMTRAAAERSGFHPLALLGQAPHAGPIVRSRGDYGISKAGDTLAHHISNMSNRLDLAGKKAQIDLLESQSQFYRARAQSEINKPRAGDAKPGVSVTAYNPSDHLKNAKVNKKITDGLEAGVGQGFRLVRRDKFTLDIVPTRDMQELTQEMEGPYAIEQAVSYFNDVAARFFGSKRAISQLRDMVRAAHTMQPLPSGAEWRYSPWSNKLVARTIGPEGSRLYDLKRYRYPWKKGFVGKGRRAQPLRKFR